MRLTKTSNMQQKIIQIAHDLCVNHREHVIAALDEYADAENKRINEIMHDLYHALRKAQGIIQSENVAWVYTAEGEMAYYNQACEQIKAALRTASADIMDQTA